MENRLQVLTLTLGELSTNCYVVADKKKKEAIIIDPADAGEYISEKLLEKGLKAKKIIATHGHFDHLLAATHLQLALDIPFLIHKEDEFLLDRMQESARHFLGRDPGPRPQVTESLQDGNEVGVGDVTFRVIHTPGHTPGSITLHYKNTAFVGDVIFAQGGVGRTDFKYSNSNDLKNSIDKILSLPKETLLLNGHGEATLVEKERQFHKDQL